jgi:hypothetical protein
MRFSLNLLDVLLNCWFLLRRNRLNHPQIFIEDVMVILKLSAFSLEENRSLIKQPRALNSSDLRRHGPWQAANRISMLA